VRECEINGIETAIIILCVKGFPKTIEMGCPYGAAASYVGRRGGGCRSCRVATRKACDPSTSDVTTVSNCLADKEIEEEGCKAGRTQQAGIERASVVGIVIGCLTNFPKS